MTTPTPFALDLPLLVDHLNKLVRQLPKGEIGPSTGSLFGGLVQRLNSCGFEDVDLLCYVCTMERTNAKGEICKSGVGLSFGMAQGNQVVGRRGERTRDGLKVHAMTQAREEAGRGAMKLRSEVLTGGAAFAWV